MLLYNITRRFLCSSKCYLTQQVTEPPTTGGRTAIIISSFMVYSIFYFDTVSCIRGFISGSLIEFIPFTVLSAIREHLLKGKIINTFLGLLFYLCRRSVGALSGAVVGFLVKTKSADSCDSSITFYPSLLMTKLMVACKCHNNQPHAHAGNPDGQ